MTDEPIDDSTKFCPDCETPNQFGELCSRCKQDRELENEEYRGWPGDDFADYNQNEANDYRDD